jgi:molecular chaperone DnaJ
MDVDLWDIFEQFFNGWWSRSRSKWRKKSANFAGEDIETTLRVDLKTSIIGGKTNFSYEKYVVCNDCKWVWGEWKSICPDCHGWGYVKYRQQTMFWTIEHTWACERCHGTWEILEKVCSKCGWQKRVRKTIETEIDIPAWIDDGMVIRMNGDGNDGIWASPWDLYVKFKVVTIEKNLRRKWVDLHYDLEIDVIEAILWTSKEIHIPIIWKRNIHIEPGTQIWTIIKIAWDGVKYIDKDKKWDLFINVIIKIPKKITDTERTAYEKIAQEKKLNVHNKKWIFEKIFW